MQQLQKILPTAIFALGASVLMLGAVALPSADMATALTGIDSARDGADAANTGGAKTTNISDIIKLIVNVLLFIIGVVSVIMIVIGGLKYTTSNGDSNHVASAKNTILYSIVGLLVAIFAYAIVNFVIDSFV